MPSNKSGGLLFPDIQCSMFNCAAISLIHHVLWYKSRITLVLALEAMLFYVDIL